MDKIQLVVVDEKYLCYINPILPNHANILHGSILKGATSASPLLLSHNEVKFYDSLRLASQKDFDEYRVCSTGYFNSNEYLHA